MEPQPGTRKEAHSSHTWKASFKQRFTWLQGALLLLLNPKSSQLQPLLLLVLLFFSLRHTPDLCFCSLMYQPSLSRALNMLPTASTGFPLLSKMAPPQKSCYPQALLVPFAFQLTNQPQKNKQSPYETCPRLQRISATSTNHQNIPFLPRVLI